MKLYSLRMEQRFISSFLLVAPRGPRYARVRGRSAEMMHEAVLAADGAALHI